MRIWLAFKVFFLILFNGDIAQRVLTALSGTPFTGEGSAPPAPSADAAHVASAAPAPPPPGTGARSKSATTRNDAITLLATLQREARLVDFLQEKLDGYTDTQIGAAVRDVHRDSAAVLERLFAIRPLAAETEGAELEVPAGFDPGRFQLTGNVSGPSPYRGHIVHTGWVATRCELPQWTGSDGAARIIAPTEVELK